MNSSELYSNNWLLAYEASVKGWLNGSDFIKDDPFFKILKDNKVEFYNSNYQVTPAMVKPDNKKIKTKEQRERRRRKRGY